MAQSRVAYLEEARRNSDPQLTSRDNHDVDKDLKKMKEKVHNMKHEKTILLTKLFKAESEVTKRDRQIEDILVAKVWVFAKLGIESFC